jgi:hypothetical protein
MADDIDVLGQSLLNRQRTTRKRSQKQNKRQRNIEFGLTLLNKGAGYANTYLKNRADTFVNEQEDMVGARVRQQQAISRSTALIADGQAAQAHPLGTQGWLAENKFAPAIRQNFERDFGDEASQYSATDIDNWVYETASKEAAKYAGAFDNAYTAAMKMGDIEDYDAYVQTRDGRAENVGGFLFNKISRSLNNTTQADIDSEVVQSIRNNRFADRADQVLLFDGYLKAGYTLTAAKNLAQEVGTVPSKTTESVLKGMGIGKAERKISGFGTERMTFFRNGEEQALQVNVIKYAVNGEPAGQVIAPFKDENGNYDKDSYDFFMNINNSDPANAASQAVSSSVQPLLNDDPDFLAHMMDPNNPDGWRVSLPVPGARITGTSGWDQTGTVMMTYWYDRNSKGRNPTPVHSVRSVKWDTVLTSSTPISDDAQQAAGAAIVRLENIMKPTGETDTVGALGIVDMIAFGSLEAYNDAVKADRNGAAQKVAGNRRAISQTIWWEASQLVEQTEQLPPEQRLTHKDAISMATSALLTPYVLAYQKKQIHNSQIISFENSKNVAMLVGESQLSTNTPYQWNETPPALYVNLIIGALDDVAKVSPDKEEYKDILVEQLRSIEGYGEATVPASAMEEEFITAVVASGRQHDAEGNFSFEQLLSFAAREPVQKAAPEEGTARLTDVPELSGVDAQLRDRLNDLANSGKVDSYFLRRVGQNINDFVSSVGATIVRDATSGPNSGSGRFRASPLVTRNPDDAAAQWQNVLATLTPEQQEEYARLKDELDNPK